MRTLVALLMLTLAIPVLAQEPPCTCTCQCQVPKPPPVEPPKAGMKFHPGHFMTLDSIRTSPEIRAAHFKQIDAIANEPSIRGVKLWLFWGTVEPTEGNYQPGFDIIDAYLAKLKQHNKYLILSVQDRIFGGYAPAERPQIFPTYLVAKYGLTKGTNVETLRVWQQPVMDRYIALVKALAARYEPHPNFEMLQTEETALSVKQGLDGYYLKDYGAQLQKMLVVARDAWPTTQLRLSINFYGSDADTLEMLKQCDRLDVAVGGPDVIPDQTIQANRVYEANLLGKMVWVSEIQSPSLGGHEGTFTPQQLYDSAMKQRPAYIVWLRNTWSGGAAQKWDTGILPFIRSVSGKVESVCPTNVVCGSN